MRRSHAWTGCCLILSAVSVFRLALYQCEQSRRSIRLQENNFYFANYSLGIRAYFGLSIEDASTHNETSGNGERKTAIGMEIYKDMDTWNLNQTKQCLPCKTEGAKVQRMVYFLGDSRVRQMYNALARKVGSNLKPNRYSLKKETENNGTLVDRENRFTAHYYSTPFPYDVERELRQRVLPFVRRPGEVSVDFVLFGFGLWTMRHPDKVDPKRSRLEAFKEGLAKVMKLAQAIPASTEVIWLYMGPMREGSLKPAARPVMTNKNVADYNGALMAEVARSERKINVWRFVNESNIIDDGMHLDVPTLEYTTKVLLKELCRMRFGTHDVSFIQNRGQ